MKSEDYSRELVYMAFSQRRLVLTITAIVFLAALAILVLMPPQYEATSAVLIRGKVVQGALDDIDSPGSRVIPVRKEDVYSEMQLLSSGELAKRTANRLLALPSYAGQDPVALADWLRGALLLEVLPSSNVIQIRLRGPDSKTLVERIDMLLDEYVSYRLAVYQPAASFDFFDRQVAAFRTAIEGYEQQLIDLLSVTHSPDPIKEIEANLLLERDLQFELNRLRARRIELDALTLRLQNAGAEDVGNLLMAQNPAVEKVVLRRVELEIERGELLRINQPGGTKVTQLQRELDQNQHLIAAELKRFTANIGDELAVTRDKIAAVELRLREIGRRNVELQHGNVLADRIRRELAQQQAAFEVFAHKREQARVSQAEDNTKLSSHVTIMERAWATHEPVFPRPILLPIGLAAGLLLGLSLALAREFLDHRFKKPSDIERLSSIPVICSIPEIPERRIGPSQQAAAWLPLLLLAMPVIVHWLPEWI